MGSTNKIESRRQVIKCKTEGRPQRVRYDISCNLCLIVLTSALRESGSESQGTVPEYTRLDPKRSFLGILIFQSVEIDLRKIQP